MGWRPKNTTWICEKSHHSEGSNFLTFFRSPFAAFVRLMNLKFFWNSRRKRRGGVKNSWRLEVGFILVVVMQSTRLFRYDSLCLAWWWVGRLANVGWPNLDEIFIRICQHESVYFQYRLPQTISCTQTLLLLVRIFSGVFFCGKRSATTQSRNDWGKETFEVNFLSPQDCLRLQ